MSGPTRMQPGRFFGAEMQAGLERRRLRFDWRRRERSLENLQPGLR